MRNLFFVILAACSSQLLKGIDLKGYIETIRACSQTAFSLPPYPYLQASNGDYFQSPFTTMLLYPFSNFPLILTKILFAGMATIFLFFILKQLKAQNLASSAQFFLTLFFSHALSDVYLALNPLFLCLGFLWVCHSMSLSNRKSHQIIAGASLAITILLRLVPVLLIPFLLLFPRRRKVALWTLLFLGAGFGTTLLFFPDPILWWGSWLRSLSLYSEAADILSPAFQSPTAVVAKWLLTLEAPLPNLIEKIFCVMTFSFLFSLAIKAEKHKQEDLAWALLVSGFYISFSRVWASGLLYCLPLALIVLKAKRVSFFYFLSFLYALLPQWLYPRMLWNDLMSRWALQGLVISGALIWCLVRVFRELIATPSESTAI